MLPIRPYHKEVVYLYIHDFDRLPCAGNSDGTFDFANYSVEAGDIQSAVQYLRSQGLKVTGLVGVSTSATRTYSQMSPFPCAALMTLARADLRCTDITCHWDAGHSKGAGSVLLYSSLHDDIANVGAFLNLLVDILSTVLRVVSSTTGAAGYDASMCLDSHVLCFDWVCHVHYCLIQHVRMHDSYDTGC